MQPFEHRLVALGIAEQTPEPVRRVTNSWPHRPTAAMPGPADVVVAALGELAEYSLDAAKLRRPRLRRKQLEKG